MINNHGRTFTPAYEVPQETHQKYWTKQNIQQDIQRRHKRAGGSKKTQAMGKENAIEFFCLYNYKYLALKIASSI